MTDLNYVALDCFDADTWMGLLNQDRVRSHLMAHPRFDRASAVQWLQAKIHLDTQPGCRVRAVTMDDRLVGWCGVQAEADHFELAAVIDPACWGVGRAVLRQLLAWARELGHQEVALHLLHTRRRYRYLERLAHRVEHNKLLESDFTTYWLAPVQ